MFDGSLELKPTNRMLKNHGLEPGGPVQKLVDSETMRYMSIYMPRRQAGELEHLMLSATVIGAGQIDIPGPYAHYLHEGILYVDPDTGSPWAKRNAIKVPAKPKRELIYAGAPIRGKKFFDRMKTDHKDDILRAAQAMANSGGR